MVKEIPLSKGRVALVDDEDYDYLSQWKWSAHSKGYASRNSPTENGRRSLILMHREILRSKEGILVDHINGDKLDNRRSNLREASARQNQRNRGANSNNTSGYKGVRFKRDISKWVAEIRVDRTGIHLGCFDNKHDAARAYNEAATELHGEFAKLNVIKEEE